MIFNSIAAYFLARKLQNSAKLNNLVRGKRVAVVGNASSLLEHQQGAKIDDHDIVIRFNAGVIKNPKSQGSRTDILGLSTPFNHHQIKEIFDPELVYWLTPKWWKMPVWPQQFNEMVEVFPKTIWRELYHQLENNRPTSGAMMVFLLAKHSPAASVTLFGFDFFQTPTNYHEDLPVNKPHAFEIERDFVQQLCQYNPDISIFKPPA